MRFLGIFLLISFTATSCTTMRYLIQAGHGQLALINQAKPIDEVIKNEKTPPFIKKHLQEVIHIKKFAEESGLKATSNYQEFVQLDRSAVVWVVSACRPLEFTAKNWSFPIAGNFNYLGWFERDDALEFADELKNENWDTYTRGASAYSTLGWFKDPVLSTMIRKKESSIGDLVNVILHESVHASLYVNDQSYFNESVATFIANKLTPVYLKDRFSKESIEFKKYQDSKNNGKNYKKKFHDAYEKLDKIYQSGLEESEKLKQKQTILSALKKDLNYKKEINNAFLIQYKTYHQGGDDFIKLFQACDKNVLRVLSVLKTLRSEDFNQKQQRDFKPIFHKVIENQCSV